MVLLFITLLALAKVQGEIDPSGMAANLQIEACIPTFEQCKRQLALLAA